MLARDALIAYLDFWIGHFGNLYVSTKHSLQSYGEGPGTRGNLLLMHGYLAAAGAKAADIPVRIFYRSHVAPFFLLLVVSSSL